MRKYQLGLRFFFLLIFCLTLIACADQTNSTTLINTEIPSITNPPSTVVVDTPTSLTPTSVEADTSTEVATPIIAPSPTDSPPTPTPAFFMSGTPAAVHETMVASGSLSEVLRGKPGKKEIAITLDAGGTAVAFPKEIAALDKYNLKVTFFLTGLWARENPQFAQEIARDGQEIANHTYSHPDLTKLSDDKIIEEINSGAKTIQEVTGVVTKPLFRFPFGAYNGHTMKILNSLGYRSIYWTYDSLDSVGTTKTSQQLIKIVTSISDAKLDGAIILMHLGNLSSGDALGPIIDNLQGRGFKIVTISELIR